MRNTISRKNNGAIAELRSEMESLRAQVALHEEYLQITADALRDLQKRTAGLEGAESSQKTPAQTSKKSAKKSSPKTSGKTSKKSSPKKGLSWKDLSREGKSSWNAYAFRSQTYGRSEEAWKRWSVDRQTMIFPRDIF